MRPRSLWPVVLVVAVLLGACATSAPVRPAPEVATAEAPTETATPRVVEAQTPSVTPSPRPPVATPTPPPPETRVFDAATGALVATFPVSSHALAAGNRALWLQANGGLELTTLDGRVLERLPAGDGGTWRVAAESANGRVRVVTNKDGAWLWPLGEAPERLEGGQAFRYAISRSGHAILTFRADRTTADGLTLSQLTLHKLDSGSEIPVGVVRPCQCDVPFTPSWSPSERYLRYWDFTPGAVARVFDEHSGETTEIPADSYWHPSRDAYFFVRAGDVWTHDMATGIDDRLVRVVRVGERYASGLPTFLDPDTVLFFGTVGPGYDREYALVDVLTSSERARWRLKYAGFAFEEIPPVTTAADGIVLQRPIAPSCEGMLTLDPSLAPRLCIPASAGSRSPEGARLAVVRGSGCAFGAEERRPIAAAIVGVLDGAELPLDVGSAGGGTWPLVPLWSEDGRYVIVTSGFCGI